MLAMRSNGLHCVWLVGSRTPKETALGSAFLLKPTSNTQMGVAHKHSENRRGYLDLLMSLTEVRVQSSINRLSN